ncbi:MAG: SpoIIE family protein phosphatase [Bacilli bacterium]|nr:SpoIIE family protein phosphatase [Bacilli bacterium]
MGIGVGPIFVLIATALSPTALAVVLHLLDKKLPTWNKLNYWLKQIIIGLAFTGVTILMCCCGVEYSGLDSNVVGREIVQIAGSFGAASAGPMIAGIAFGWPAGLITGALSGLFRGLYSLRIATDYLAIPECITLLISGLVAAILRRFLFSNKKPKWGYGLILGIMTETIHMIIFFVCGVLTRNVTFAYAVIRVCDIPCAIAVTGSIVLTLLIISIIEKERIGYNFHDHTITAKVRRWMLGSFMMAIIGASLLTYFACSTQASVETHTTLVNAARDLTYELETSVWGSVGGWDIAHKTDDPDEPPINELAPLAYTRRILNDGYLAIIGITSNYTDPIIDADNQSPFNVITGGIYSTCAELTAYLPDPSEPYIFYFSDEKGEKNFPINDPSIEEKFTDTINIPLGLETDQYDNHKMTPMFKTYLRDAEGDHQLYPMMVLIMRARVTGDNDITITQEFDVISVLPLLEAQTSMGLSLRIAIYIELLIFIAIYTVIYTFIKNAVVSNIHRVNNSLQKITGGNLGVKVNVRSSEEFASLSDDINTTVDTLKHYIDQANRRIDDELRFAKEIQHGALTNVFPVKDNYDLHALMSTAKEVGGDFYDFYPLDENRLVISICDVSGKGIPAAMFMMRSKTIIKSYITNQDYTLSEAITRVNNELCANNEAMMFVTGWFGILHLDTGVLEFCNAGHNPPLIKQNGMFNYLKMPAGLVLAGMEDIPYKLNSITLKPGDEIFLYTDGVTEATSKQVKLYGEDRLVNLLNNAQYHSAKGLLDIVKQDVDLFQADVSQADDITMLAVRYKPSATFAEQKVVINPRLDEIKDVINFVNKALVMAHVEKKHIAQIDIGLDEILSNVVLRTYHFENGKVIVGFEIKSDVCTITIEDNGKETNFAESINQAHPGLALTEENIPTIGLLLVKKTMHSIHYQFKDNKNVLVVKKHIK